MGWWGLRTEFLLSAVAGARHPWQTEHWQHLLGCERRRRWRRWTGPAQDQDARCEQQPRAASEQPSSDRRQKGGDGNVLTPANRDLVLIGSKPEGESARCERNGETKKSAQVRVHTRTVRLYSVLCRLCRVAFSSSPFSNSTAVP
jgi:hypothetical protein